MSAQGNLYLSNRFTIKSFLPPNDDADEIKSLTTEVGKLIWGLQRSKLQP